MTGGPRLQNQYEMGSRQETIIAGLCENVARALLAQRRIYEITRRQRDENTYSLFERSAGAIIRADENALLGASWKALRYLEVAIAEELIPANYADRLAPLKEQLKDVRDMREHDDEYRLGGGRNRKRHVHRDEESGFAMPADWTLIIRDRYLLGGRLPLYDLTIAVRQLFRDLETGGFWILPWRDLGLAEYGPLPEE